MSATLSGTIRSKTGKSHAREARRKGLLPAVVYGQKNTVAISINPKELVRIMKQKGRNALIDLDLKSDSVRKVLLKDYQSHPLQETWVHADFYEVDLKKALKVQVPVKLTGTAPGEKKGGTLNHVIRVLNMECLPDNIPEAIEAPINELDLGQSIHVSDLNIPESANVLTPAGATVAIVNVEKVKEETTAEEETVETEAKPTETATGDAENK
tara:strand:+ start:227 stop:862 length:636 start_codon:yes stop_codon:yes gene_type:complete